MVKQLAHLLVGLCAIVLVGTGCASKWALNVDASNALHQWRDDANMSHAVHLESIKGFKETGAAASNVLRYLVFGRRSEDNTIVRPVAAAVGSDDRIAIADAGRLCVHLYVPSEQRYRQINEAGTEKLRAPVSVAFDDALRLFVSDSSNHAVYVYDRDGEHLFTVTQAGSEPLQRPTGLSVSSREKIIYVVDTLANRVHAFTTEGNFLFSFGAPGESSGQFNFPTHIASHSDGNLYVTDAMNFRVQIFNARGSFLASFGHHGNGSGDFAMPKGIAVDKDGVIYVVDTLFDNVQLFDLSGAFLFTIGARGGGLGEFSMPSGLFLDRKEKLYVCDTYNQRVQVFQIVRYEK
jgi:DNA-binding beta-propeller fold protein YncE